MTCIIAPRLAALVLALVALTTTHAAVQTVNRRVLVREFLLGNDSADERTLFTRIKALLPAPDGRQIVADFPVAMKVFSPQGKLSHIIGRSGGGPGEFQSLDQVGLIQDTLWSTDVRSRRTTLFRLDGTVIATIPWANVDAAIVANQGRNVVTGLFSNGTAWGEFDGHLARTMRGLPESDKAVVRMSRSGSVSDTIIVVPTVHSMYAVGDGTTFSFGAQRFPDAPVVIGFGAQSRIAVIDRSASRDGSRSSVQITCISATGNTLWKRALEYVPKRLEKSATDSFVNSVLRSTQRLRLESDVVRRALFLPSYRPPVTAAFASSEGELWIRREDGADAVEYWVISATGNLIASLATPKNLTLLAARGQNVWGVERDENDVPTIVKFRY